MQNSSITVVLTTPLQPYDVIYLFIYLFIWVGVTNEQLPAPWLTYSGFPPNLDLVPFGFVLVNFTNLLFEGLSPFVQGRVVLHLFVLPRIPFVCDKRGSATISDAAFRQDNIYNKTCNVISRNGNKNGLSKTWICNWLFCDVDKKKALIGVITQALLLHNSVNTGDYFGAEEDIISGI